MHPKVLDFGISKGNDAVTQAGTLTGTGAMIGTPYYLAPEQIMDSKSAGVRPAISTRWASFSTSA